jgi:hypothetical protein
VLNFKGAHFEAAAVLTCVYWYVAYSLNFRQLQAGHRQPQPPATDSESPTLVCVFQPATTALNGLYSSDQVLFHLEAPALWEIAFLRA